MCSLHPWLCLKYVNLTYELTRESDQDVHICLFTRAQVKVSTGAKERQKQDNQHKENGFNCGGHRQLVSPYPSWLILLYFWVLLASLSPLVACGGTWNFPVLLPFCRAGKGNRRASTQHQIWYLLLNEPYKITSIRLLVWMLLTKLSETDSMRLSWVPNVL